MRRLLIANRGEIAVRIIRTAREMGIETVLASSETDMGSVAGQLADQQIAIGPAPASKSYLNGPAMLGAAANTQCDAVHPGYGFLSENADFARQVKAAGLIWVGPSAEAIEQMGDKSRARQSAKAAGVPTLRGTEGVLDPMLSPGALTELAAKIGFPLVVKASAGGGGRGIRLVTSTAELLETVDVARAEAAAAFGNPDVYLEQFIENARHVEVQILGDGARVIHLGDRDCSMQRRQQKLIEEAPAPNLPAAVREEIQLSSVRLAEACAYSGLGTVEFLYDPKSQQAAFIEMNTRLQVEHPVTELITGLDLVREQLLIAGGRALELAQEDVRFLGHAFEFRLNAEDPSNNFMPSPGTLTHLQWPEGPGVRVDSGVRSQSAVAPFYDSLLAKIIVWDESRQAAISRAQRALDETEIGGVQTTLPLLKSLAARPELAEVTHHSKFIETTPGILEVLV